MTQEQLCDKLIELGFNSGWGVRNGKIVVWENKEKIPDTLSEYIELD
jgi:hypothetical protein